MAYGTCSVHSSSPARPVDRRARGTLRSSDLSVCIPSGRLETGRTEYYLPY